MGLHRFIPPLALLLPAALALLQLFPSAFCRAQERRLSFEPPISVQGDLRIQSAARAGTVTYAAWASIGASDGGLFDSLLVGQAIDNTTPMDQPIRLNEISAAPCNFVKVIAFDSSFVVIWSDRRSDPPGVWVRPIGLNGRPLGAEAHVAGIPGPVDSNVCLVQNGRVATLVWQQWHQSRLWLLTVDADGKAVRFDSLGGTTLEQVHQAGAIAALRIDSAGEGRVVLADGTIARARALSGTSPMAAHISDDGSLAVLTDSSLKFYSHWQDSVPVRSVRVESLVPPYQSARFAILRSSGAFILDRVLNQSAVGLQSAGRRAILTRATLSDSLAVIDSTQFAWLDTMEVWVYWSGPRDYGSTYAEPFTLVARQNGGYAARMRVHRRVSDRHNNDRINEYVWIGFDVDSAGNWRRSAVPLPPAVFTGGGSEPIPVRRVDDSMHSTIAVGADSIVLRVGIRVDGSYIDQSWPTAYRVAGQFRVAWVESVMQQSNMVPQVTRARLQSTSADPTPVSVGSIAPYDSFRKILRTAGGLIWTAVRYISPLTPELYYRFEHDIIRREMLATPNAAPMTEAAYEPDNDDLCVLHMEVNSIRDYRLNREDTIVRQTSAETWNYQRDCRKVRLPLRGTRILSIDYMEATLLDSCRPVVTVRNPVAFGTTSMRLRGDQILTWRYFDSCACYRFDRLQFRDDPARLVHLATGWLNTPATDLCPVEVPQDSSIVVLAGGRGVRMYRMSRLLGVLDESTLLTTGTHRCDRPWGVFEEGKLFVVWEDYRSTKSDIYSTTLAVEGTPEPPPPEPPPDEPPPDEPPPDPPQVFVVPLPAHDVLQVVVRTFEAVPISCDLFDASGRLLTSQSIGASETGTITFVFPTRTRPDGLYLVRTRVRNSVSYSRALVVHSD